LVIIVVVSRLRLPEILAATIQDYKRRLSFGGKQSLWVGNCITQNVLDLNQFVRNANYGDLGR